MAGPGPGGATRLVLAPDLPSPTILPPTSRSVGELGDGKIASDRPTAIFFGTSHCWNTNREAERFVAVAGRAEVAVRFWWTRPPAASRRPSSRGSTAAIPTLAILDSAGKVIYNRSGETASRAETPPG